MAINFSVNDVVRVVPSYVDITLKDAGRTGKVAASVLGSLGRGTLTVTATGNLGTLSFIKLLPADDTVPGYRSGRGSIIYFSSDEQLNNSLELSNAFFCDSKSVEVYNDTGSTLSKGNVVYNVAYNATQQLPTVDLSNASAAPTALCFGILEEDIADGSSGSCIVSGSVIIDVGTMSVGDIAYLADTDGQINPTSSPGSISVPIGIVESTGTSGSISISGNQPFGAGGGGGSQGTTGLAGPQGDTGITGVTGIGGLQGDTGISGFTGLEGPAGAAGSPGSQGVTGFAGQTGVQGLQGATGSGGLQGVTGLQGIQGTQGDTGIQGLQGATGTGTQGDTGIAGDQGATGLGADGNTGLIGATGIQGLQGNTGTGVQGDTGLGANGETGLIGATGITGNQGDTGITGNTGMGTQGATGVGQTGIQGNTGLSLQGVTGLQGPGGMMGDTGIDGMQGDTGIQGNQGDTGLTGDTGIQGLTGILGSAVQGDTGIQGVTGVGSGGSGNVTTLATVDAIDAVLGATEIFLYNVPGASSAVVTQIVLRLTTADGITTPVTAAAGFGATPTSNVFAPTETTGVTATDDLWTFASSAKAVVGAGGATLTLGVTGMAGNTGIFSADVIGYEF